MNRLTLLLALGFSLGACAVGDDTAVSGVSSTDSATGGDTSLGDIAPGDTHTTTTSTTSTTTTTLDSGTQDTVVTTDTVGVTDTGSVTDVHVVTDTGSPIDTAPPPDTNPPPADVTVSEVADAGFTGTASGSNFTLTASAAYDAGTVTLLVVGDGQQTGCSANTAHITLTVGGVSDTSDTWTYVTSPSPGCEVTFAAAITAGETISGKADPGGHGGVGTKVFVSGVEVF